MPADQELLGGGEGEDLGCGGSRGLVLGGPGEREVRGGRDQAGCGESTERVPSGVAEQGQVQGDADGQQDGWGGGQGTGGVGDGGDLEVELGD
ncbi:MAG TPA: hypothetical protein VF070_21280 [Streptosporangiaceae bacterium]